ncbi:MAG: 16S rRNA (cytidine(1402)-2'-O)-methyltransferase [Candidatus Moraniibacteriota bacterium]|nr:MAG: 16S rRNA (cytidine(1402)-2'-O)-methyltransferase [Candidatus Moranbacteria bacterium]
MSGILYVIGTPIGNLGDITLRAIEALDKIDVLYCEDSRVASRLINHLIETGRITKKPRYIPYNEYNESRMGEVVAGNVAQGLVVGLVSDAGMPGISDPGYRAIRTCHDKGLTVQVIPGVTALTTAIPYSGIGGEVTIYAGFLPKTTGRAERILRSSYNMMQELGTGRVVLYVSPHRLLKDLELIYKVMGNVHCVLLRELTKLHEERVEGSLTEIMEKYKHGVKGELVLVLAATT